MVVATSGVLEASTRRTTKSSSLRAGLRCRQAPLHRIRSADPALPADGPGYVSIERVQSLRGRTTSPVRCGGRGVPVRDYVRLAGCLGVYEEPREDDSFIVPFATPFIAGPGAITSVITLSAEGTGWTSIVTVLIAVTIPLVALTFGMLKLGNLELKPTTMKLIGQAGGLFIATIGIQLVLGGIDRYYNG